MSPTAFYEFFFMTSLSLFWKNIDIDIQNLEYIDIDKEILGNIDIDCLGVSEVDFGLIWNNS